MIVALYNRRVESTEQITIDKLVHGGQGIGILPDGRKCFVWGALPGEVVNVQLTKKKRDWTEGIATEIITLSPNRITALEPEIYIATSPWQIMDYGYEASAKQEILVESFAREHVDVSWQDFYQGQQEYGYRNKMEYNFWFFNETQQVSLALHMRGTHLKVAVIGSALASDKINKAGQALVAYINANKIEARPLKSVILRSDGSGQVGISLFVNDKDITSAFSKFNHPNSIFEIVYSNPKSPASVATEVLKTQDDKYLVDKLLAKNFKYTTRSFFQVNIPIYEAALKEIMTYIKNVKTDYIIDMYSGVGSIGLSVIADAQKLLMIETSKESTDQAQQNMVGRTNCEVITTTAEAAVGYITGDETIILDPPRAGLHKDVTYRLIDSRPTRIIYLSCNPSTQARDVKLLTDNGYKITQARGYNFFPRTPHIECLIVLDKVQ